MTNKVEQNAITLKGISAEIAGLHDGDPALEGLWEKIVTEFDSLVVNIRDMLSGTVKETEIYTPRQTKLLIDELDKPYLVKGEGPVTKIDYFKGDLAPFVELYFDETSNLAEDYKKLLDSYQSSLISVASTGDPNVALYRSNLSRVLETEKNLSKKLDKWFKGNINDAVKLTSLLPNEKHFMDFCKSVFANRGHILLKQTYYDEILHLTNISAIALNDYNMRNKQSSKSKTLVKAIAKDGYEIAEMASIIAGRGYMIQQIMKIYAEANLILREK